MISTPDPSQTPKRKYNILNDPSFLASNTMPPFLKPPQKPDLTSRRFFIEIVVY